MEWGKKGDREEGREIERKRRGEEEPAGCRVQAVQHTQWQPGRSEAVATSGRKLNRGSAVTGWWKVAVVGGWQDTHSTDANKAKNTPAQLSQCQPWVGVVMGQPGGCQEFHVTLCPRHAYTGLGLQQAHHTAQTPLFPGVTAPGTDVSALQDTPAVSWALLADILQQHSLSGQADTWLIEVHASSHFN